MVFEAVVVEFLNKFLNQYVENLDTSQLKIGIWGGDVFLSDLKIKTSLCDDWNLPIKVKWGKLGKFFMKIPWKNLYSSNVVIEIENLLVIIVPNSELKYDPAKEEKWAQDKKQEKLKAIAEAKKREAEGVKVKENDSFVEKLVTQITKNLQIAIKNVHIRYEDNSTTPGSPFSVGLTLSNLSAHTTSEDPTLKFSTLKQAIENFICKVVDLEGLAVYWNTNSALFSDLPTKNLINFLLESIPKVNFKPEGFMYMFGPISVSAFLRLNPKPESSSCNFTIPKIFCNVHLKDIDLAITHHQFSEAMTFLQNIQRLNRAVKYKKYRPDVPVIGHANKWWAFAYAAIVEDISRRKREWNWENIRKHRTMCRRYAELFRIKLNSKKCPQNVLMELKNLEKELNVFNLVLIREQVYVEVEREQKKKEVKSSGGWFSGWFGYGHDPEGNQNEEHIVKKIESVMTSDEKQKLYKAIGYEESAPPTNYPITFVEAQFWFHLEEMKLTVYDGYMDQLLPLMVVSVKNVRVELEQRPSAFAMKFVMTIGKFQVTGKEEPDKTFPVLVTSNCKESESLIEILFETKPLDSSCDQRIIVNARPLSIIFHAATLNLVRDVFKTDDSEEMEKIKAATSASLPNFPKITSLGLQYAIEKQSVIEVKVNIMSSHLIIPYAGVYKPGVEMLVIMLGHLSVESQENSRKDLSVKKLYLEGTTGEELFSAVVSASYTNFTCNLKGVQILFQLNGENWETASRMKKSSLQFLEPTNLEVTIKKSLVMDDARIPKIIIEGKLPSITINFSEERFMSFVALALSIPRKVEEENSLAASKKKVYSSTWSLQSIGTQLESKLTNKPKNIYLQKDSTDYVQGIDLVGHFEMSELKVNVIKTKEVQTPKTEPKKTAHHVSEEEFLTIRIMILEIEITKKTFEHINLLKLGGIDVKQYLNKKMLPFVATKGMAADHYLFVVEYVNLDARLPDFYTSRKAILNRLSLNITPLNILINQEGLLAIIAFVTKVQKRVREVKGNSCELWQTADGKTKDLKDVESTHTEKKIIGKGRTFRKKRFQKEMIDFYLEASLDELDIEVEFDRESEEKGLADFSVKGGSVSISSRKSGTTLDMNIREVLLLDLNKLTKHQKIVASLEKQTLSCRITLYNKEYLGLENSLDGSVDAEVGCIQLTYVNLFFIRALEFMNAFQFRESLKETASLAAQKAKDNMMKAFQNAAQICLNIKIKAPLLIIPKSSHHLQAIVLDMGKLTFKNAISELDYSYEKHVGKNPVLDISSLHLQNLKATRCTLREDGTGFDDEVTFLIPLTFELTIKRNLSHIWFKLIPELDIYARLGTIYLTLTHEDLCIIAATIKENSKEGVKPSIDSNQSLQKSKNKTDKLKPVVQHELVNEEEEDKSTDFYTSIKFTFSLESFVFDLRNITLNEMNIEEKTGLARFVLETISIKGRIFSNGSIQTSMILVSCLLDDMRPGKEGGLTRLMERSRDEKIDASKADSSKTSSMIEVIYQKNQLDSFVDVRVYKFTLVLSMDFLQKLSMFFTLEYAESPSTSEIESHSKFVKDRKRSTREIPTSPKETRKTEETLVETRKRGTRGTLVHEPTTPEDDPTTFTINIRLEKPDIIFVERMDSINTDALVFHTELIVKYRVAGSKKVITATVTDMELYSCCFNPDKRAQTLNQVIKPFTISVAGSTPEYSGLHIDICSTNIRIIINPFTVDLITKCCIAFLKDSTAHEKSFEENSFADLWEAKPMDPDKYWFFKPEEGIDALEIMKPASSFRSLDTLYGNEICLLAMPSIKIFVEGLTSNGTHPMVLLEMGFQMQCFNWSQKMSITNTLTVEANYYNPEFCVWEPIIEPVENTADCKKNGPYKVWELACYITYGDEGEIDDLRPPKIQVTLSCDETLQLCFTKASLDVLKFAVETFSKAGLRKSIVSSFSDVPPIVVKNETGLTVELLLDQSELKACQDSDNEHNVILLEPSSEIELCDAYTTADAGRAYPIPSTDRRISVMGRPEPRLHVQFPIAENHVFELRLSSTGKRCYPFPLEYSENEFRCLVSDVSVKERTTVVVLQSPVEIVNYFNEAINVHFLTNDGNSAEYAGIVEGNSSLFLPFHAVYSEKKSFFFSTNGYSLSDEPFVWENLSQELNTSILVQCTSKDPENEDPFFIQVSGETKPVFFANTKQKTTSSVVCVIHLQPTLKIFNSLPVPLIFHFQGSARDQSLQPGHHLQVYNAEPGLSSITLRISNYLEKEWSCKELFQDNPPEFLIWDFVSYNGLAPETLTLGVYVTYLKKTAVFTIYSPYFTVNKTELLLAYRFENGNNVFYQPGDFKAPLMLSVSGKKFFSKKSLYLQVNSSSWSGKFPIDVVGSGGTVECEEINSAITYRISVTISFTYNGLTKIVLFTPFFNLLNTLNYTIECQESDFPREPWQKILPGSCLPFWPRSTAIKKTMHVRIEGSDSVTPPFAYDNNDSCLLRLSHKCGGIFVRIKSTPSGNCIKFSPYEPGQAPVLIINHSDKIITVFETGTSFSLTLRPSQEVMHAWVQPTGDRSLTLTSAKNAKNVITLDQDEEGLAFTTKGESLRYVSFLEGTQRILVLTEDFELSRSISSVKMTNSGLEVICKIQGVGISLVNNASRIEVLYLTLTSSGITWESKKERKRLFKKLKEKEFRLLEEAYQKYLESREGTGDCEPIVNVSDDMTVDFEEMKVVEPSLCDLRRTYEPGFYLAFRQIEDQIMLHVKINRIQIDNQLHDCIFPVVLAPLPPPKTVAVSNLGGPKPFFELSILKITDKRSGVSQYKYFKTLVQEFHVQIDIAFLHEFFDFMASKPLTDDQQTIQFQKNNEYMEKPLSSHVEIITQNEQKCFYEMLHFSPLKIHFSFSMAGKFESSGYLPQKIGVLVQSIGVTLTDVNDVIIRLGFLEKKGEFLTRSEIMSDLVSHYYSQLIKQAHVLLLGLDVIGNPYGLIVGIGQGVEDFFYEPFQGMIQGPSEFGKGMALGCKSLFGHTVGSAAGTLGKLTGTLGKGLAVLSLDKEYQMQRMMNQHRNEEIHASMARGGKGLLMGVVEGVTGVVKKPIKGAKEEGFGGFFKGMGKGMMGLVTRPVSGVVDFASTSLNAVNRAAKVSFENKRVRPPRFFRDEILVQPYSLKDAEGNSIFRLLTKQKFAATDKYEYHLRLNPKEVVLMTNKRIIFAELSEMFGTWQVHLAIPWSSMPERPHSHTKGIALSIPRRSNLKKDKPEVKVLLIKDECVKRDMCKKMVELYEIEKDQTEQIEPYRTLSQLTR